MYNTNYIRRATMNKLETYQNVFAVNVDIQNDFCPGGSLAVNEGDQVVPIMNRVNKWTRSSGGDVVLTADWHPPETYHFVEYGGPWITHCVRFTIGAAFHEGLQIKADDTVALKGTGNMDDGYSGWFAEFNKDSPLYKSPEEMTLSGRKKADAITTVGEAVLATPNTALVIGGLATDYCVKATVLDAIREVKERDASIGIFVVRDAIRAVNIQPDDGANAIEEMRAAGAVFVTSNDLVNNKIFKVAA